MKLTNKTILFLFLLPAVLGAGCKKFIEIPPPKTQLQTEVVFSTDASALSALNGLYSQLTVNSLTMLNGGITLYAGLSADEITNTTTDISLDQYVSNSVSPQETGLYGRLWSNAYKYIYQTNAILQGVSSSHSITDSVGKQIRGEALVIRSLYYFYLVNLFGDVPLVLSTDYRENAVMQRTSSAQVYKQITTDLTEAKSILKERYPSVNKARPNKWTATALLSRVYLYNKQWQDAEAQASEILGAGMYSLASPAGTFLAPSPETIWQLVKDNNNTAEGASFIPSSATVKPTYSITAVLLNAFQSGDQRKSAWLSFNTINAVPYYYPYKYRSRVSTPISEYYVVMRLAEQYLIRAEARAQQDKLPEAISDINAVRARAGLAPLLQTLLKSQVISAVERERQTELFCEWGHRWFDLKRTSRIDAVLGSEKQNWQPTDALFPLPQQELQTNPYLVQNPGY